MPLCTDEHEEIRREVRKFTEEKIVPIAADIHTNNKEIPPEIIREMGDLGYFGMIFPEELGGVGLDYVSMAVVTEELSRGLLSAGSVMTRNIITGTLLQNGGNEEQKKRFLPGLASAELMSAAAFTEPDNGSDLAGIKLRATKDGDHYILHGEKTWCTFANRANILAVLARTDPDASKRHKGLSIFLVEKEPSEHLDHPNIAGGPIPTIGYHGMKSFTVSFDECRVPAENLLGMEEGRGFYHLMSTFEAARIQTAARAVGVAQAAFEEAVKYSKERNQFGKSISEFQIIRHKLSEMWTELEAARYLTYVAAEKKDRGERCDLEAGVAKAKAAQMAEFVTREAMQVFGSYGYSSEYPMERFWRDARVFSIFEGTSEIQHEVIARRLLEVY
ncbi:MAG: acyl-CoA dehydrogenase family protein [Candidatus Dadabacteria bacterium]|nr:acyl-CoA dehydrogenase family protein [Candidatus Dadabacteria bacterium]MCY4043130.1 acyl-CoA dehydrogenase family protein [Candidatus Dadabacteria bacterium]MCY4047031.1 acyl-CoA dehydrogenase family protein [Candidatus Dadabacteria bacterium]